MKIFVTILLCLFLISHALSEGDELIPTSRVRGCYFTNWSQYRPGRGRYSPSNYVPGLCTHIFYAFAFMNEDCTILPREWNDESTPWSKGQYEKVNDWKHSDANLKTLLSVGGWTMGTRLFQKMVSAETYRKAFLDSSISLLRQYNFDGLDLDWEYPTGDSDKANFVIFLQEARALFHADAATSGKTELLLTIAGAAGLEKIQSGYDIPGIARYVDYISIMSYDFHGAWEDHTDMNSPLFSRPDESGQFKYWDVSYASNYWYQQGAPKNKIIIGLPTYGRGWTLQDASNHGVGAPASGPSNSLAYTREAGTGSYYELCGILNEGGTRYWNNVQKQPYMVLGNQWFSYDDVESFNVKLQWLVSQSYGGAFVWSLDDDDFNGGCPSSNDQKYPLIRLMQIAFSGGVMPTNPPTLLPPPPTTTTSTSTTTTTSTSTSTTQTVVNPVTSTVPQNPVTQAQTTNEGCGGQLLCSICSGKPEGFYSATTDCASFIECYRHTAYLMHCPSGLYYSSARHMCVVMGESDCQQPTTTAHQNLPTTTTTLQHPTQPSGPFHCPGTGIYADPSSMCNFYICSNGVAFQMTCPTGSEYVPLDHTCELLAPGHHC